jgi:hypothetical protein
MLLSGPHRRRGPSVMNQWPGPVRPGIRHDSWVTAGESARPRVGSGGSWRAPPARRGRGAVAWTGFRPDQPAGRVALSSASKPVACLACRIPLLAAGDSALDGARNERSPEPVGFRASVGRCAPRPSPPRSGPLPAAGASVVEATANLALARREAVRSPPPSIGSAHERLPSPGWAAGRGIGGTDQQPSWTEVSRSLSDHCWSYVGCRSASSTCRTRCSWRRLSALVPPSLARARALAGTRGQ